MKTPDVDSQIHCAIVIHCIRERLNQHRENLALWQSGALRASVEDDEEQFAVMHDLRVAIAELKMLLKQANMNETE